MKFENSSWFVFIECLVIYIFFGFIFIRIPLKERASIKISCPINYSLSRNALKLYAWLVNSSLWCNIFFFVSVHIMLKWMTSAKGQTMRAHKMTGTESGICINHNFWWALIITSIIILNQMNRLIYSRFLVNSFFLFSQTKLNKNTKKWCHT